MNPSKSLEITQNACKWFQRIGVVFFFCFKVLRRVSNRTKTAKFYFESAAYANFATPVAFNFNSLPEPVPKPIGHVAYGDWLLDTVKLPSPRSA